MAFVLPLCSEIAFVVQVRKGRVALVFVLFSVAAWCRPHALRRLLLVMMKNTTIVPVLDLRCHYHVAQYFADVLSEEEVRYDAASPCITFAIKSVQQVVISPR